MINVNTIHILVIYTFRYSSVITQKIHFHIQYFTISNQFKYDHKFNSVLQFSSVMQIDSVISINSFMQISSVMLINSVMSINSIMPLMNLTYVFDIYRISESPARSRWAAGRYKNGFITQYCPAGLLTGYSNQIVNTTDTVPLGC